MPLLTPLTSQVVSDTSEASATARQTAATAWRQVICSGKGRDSDREHSGSGREHSGSGNGRVAGWARAVKRFGCRPANDARAQRAYRAGQRSCSRTPSGRPGTGHAP